MIYCRKGHRLRHQYAQTWPNWRYPAFISHNALSVCAALRPPPTPSTVPLFPRGTLGHRPSLLLLQATPAPLRLLLLRRSRAGAREIHQLVPYVDKGCLGKLLPAPMTSQPPLSDMLKRKICLWDSAYFYLWENETMR